MKTILQHTFLSLLLFCWSTSYAFNNVPTNEQCYKVSICEGNAEYEERICETSMQMTSLPELSSPADQAANVALAPTLQWAGMGSSYTLEVYSCNPDYSKVGKLHLNDFTADITNTNIANVSDDFSGATYNPTTNATTGTYFYVTNGSDSFAAERVVELDNNGNWIREIKLNDEMNGTPDFDDTEGIVWIGGDDYLIIEERRQRIHKVTIDDNTTSIAYPSNYIQLSITGCTTTDCIEGITYNAFTNEVLIVNEIAPKPEIYVFTLPPTISGVVNITPTQPFNAQTKLGVSDLAGLHHFSLTDGVGNMNINDHFLVLSEASKRLLEVDMAGTIHGTLYLTAGNAGLSASVNQPEGVTMDNEGNIYIASEPDHFYKFRNPTLDLNPFNLASNTTYSNTNVSSNSFTIPAGQLGGNIEYCWRVKDNTTGAWSEYRSFTTESVVCNSNYNALIALHQATDGANWTNTWDLSQPVSTWYGVTLNANGCVTNLELNNNNLNGSMPAELGALTEVEWLELDGNNLSGNIPPELGNLSNLIWLSLHTNNLTGGLPASLGNLINLEVLSVTNNQLTGCYVGLESLCPELPSWANQHISDGNYFNVPWEYFCATGDCAPNPCVAADRDALIAFYNSVQGLSWDLSQPVNTWEDVTLDANGCVIALDLSEHSATLTGTIAPEIGNLSNLTALDLTANQLSGSIPAEIGNLSNLSYLALSGNQLDGNIPATLANLSGLTGLSLASNQLSGCYDNNLMTLCGQLTGYSSTNAAISNGNNFDVPWEYFCATGSCTPSACSISDRDALVAFYNTITNWGTIMPWDITQSMSTWQGVTLNGDGCVTRLELSWKGMVGSIPPELGNLSNLTYLSLWNNSFTGNIPPELGNLSNLTHLHLHENDFTGNIPPELGNLSNLESLNLWYNNLSGSIPPELGNLSNLTELYLLGNQLSASIPPELGNLSNLVDLRLEDNNLSGSIPPELGNLSSLTHLRLGVNQLSGSIPPELGNLSALTHWVMTDNQFSGSIPPELGMLNNLEALVLSNNNLSGSIPPEFGNMSSLEQLGLNNNQLTGNIPEELCNPPLTTLSLSNNNLSGTIPACILNMANAYLDNNAFGGNLPAIAGNVGNLRLQNNQLTGCYDPSLASLCGQSNNNTNISDGNNFDVSWEDFCNTGAGTCIVANCAVTDYNALVAFHNSITDWGNMTPWDLAQPMNSWIGLAFNTDGCVTAISLDEKSIDGTLPPELGDLTSLTYLDLGDNNFIGNIPVELGNLTNLTYLNLDGNGLTGSIPAELGNLSALTTCYLGYNQLSGSIPTEWGNLANLITFNINGNQLTGNIPASIGNLTNLNSFSLNNNQLTGSIPPELGNLYNLTYTALHNNQLTGEIPTALGNLSNLTGLSLHNNQLTGCYDNNLTALCGQLTAYFNTNAQISNGNTLDADWEDFCNNGAGNCAPVVCTSDYNALVAFHNAITDWGSMTPWDLTQPMSTWAGLSLNADACVTAIDFDENYVDGTLPPELGNLSNLTFLHLGDNNFTGSIPPELGNLSNLTYLNLSGNGLTGSIPAELGNLSSLEIMYMTYNQLSGSIPVELGNLSSLTTMSLGSNQLSGSIPSELGNLSNLISLTLRANQLTGSIPVTFANMSSLTNLSLYNNQLSGCYDSNLATLCGQLSSYSNTNGSMSNGNNFDAPWEDFCLNGIGGCVTNATSCRYSDSLALVALYNATDGANWTTPWDLTQPMDSWANVVLNSTGCVTSLYLYNQGMTGPIPPELGTLDSLEYMHFWSNDLTGSIPAELGNMSSLINCILYRNDLSGAIPEELGNISSLKSLRLSENQLSGAIPGELGNLTNLTDLRLDYNQLSGFIPSEIGNLNNLTRLYLNHNQLIGNLPVTLGNLTSLQRIYLNNNQLEGGLPGSFSNMTSLTTLSTYNNQLSGCYDNSLLSLCGQLPSYSSTNVSISNGNNFDAPWEDFCTTNAGNCTLIPTIGAGCQVRDSLALAALYHATDGDNWAYSWDMEQPTSTWNGVSMNEDGCVTYLNLSANSLKGTLPPDLGNLGELTGLSLHNNELNGSIPTELGYLLKLEEIYLYSNQLTGSIPAELGDLADLRSLWLSNNQLTDSIPATLGNLANLTSLYLNNNQLEGNIPPALGDMISVRTVWLANNQLSGNIPAALGNLPDLSNLGLYNNQLTDCYPISLVNICAYSDNGDISDGNNFDMPWEDFCANGAAACESCPSDLNLSNPLITRAYQAGTTLSSESTAPAGTDVQFKAGDVILLDKGFSIEPGSSFSGEIEDCIEN